MKKTLLLVDGSSYLYRAYHAMPDLRNADGEPTGALYGVINMMRRLALDHTADWLACVFDARGPTFRDELYPDYKANRDAMPDDLARQIEPIHAAIRAMGWPVISIAGVEADDIIGTLAVQATARGVHTIISTGDKDLAQLVDGHVSLINTMSGERLDEEGVRAKFGVPPTRIVDYLMLVGDTADNVPGVPKVGPKTAAKWLGQYDSLDNLVAHAAEIKGVAGQNLRDAIERFELSRTLITVKTDCDLDGHLDDFEDLRPKPVDTETLVGLYERFGFRSWLREVTGDTERIPEKDARIQRPAGSAIQAAGEVGQAQPEGLAVADVRYDTVADWETFDDWLERLRAAELVAIDTETAGGLGAMQMRLVGISLATEPGRGCYIPLAHRYAGLAQDAQLPMAEVLERLRPWLEDDNAAKLLHHAKFDTHAFANAGIALRGIRHDTMLQAYVLESHKSVGLNELAERWLGRRGVSYQDLCGKGASQIGFDEVAIETAAHYAAEDADFTLQLHRVLLPQVEAEAGLERIYRLEIQVSRVLAIMERHGVRLDGDVLRRQSQELGAHLAALEAKAYELAGQPFNLNSPKQLGQILFEQMGLPVVRKTASGAPSTDEEVLTRLAQDYPLPQTLLEYRSLAKLKSTYTDKLPRMICEQTGRLHTSYAQAAVVTGRLASSEPNLQNIPVRTPEGRHVRTAFVAAPGFVMMSADYSQIELRVMAHVADEANLQAAFARGEDIHRATASEVFGVALDEVNAEQRRAAKAINFGLMYGMGPFGLAANLGITRDAAQVYIDRYFARYPGVAQYMESIRSQARELGYVETVFGRRLWLPEIRGGSGPRRQAAERAAINAPMQGTAADLIKMAMVAVQDWLEAGARQSRLILQVHDELVLEVAEAELEEVRVKLPELMCQVATLRVPLMAEVGVGPNWERAH
ncbi:MAG: DNA polymerase I [Pigmentiphaga sp.]|nr:DNA polymerase I [Pigmentiphaga sp.]